MTEPKPLQELATDVLAKEAEFEGHSTDRLLAFSDGVFSIAITLLVLELKVPPIRAGETSVSEVFRALADEWPVLVAYLLGFSTIGIMWSNHTTIFRYIRRTDHKLVALNSLLLLFVSLGPFTTNLLATYLPLGDPYRQAGMIIYAAVILLIALTFNRLWHHVLRPPRTLVDHDVSEAMFDAVTSRYRFGPHMYAVALILAFFNSTASLVVVLGLAVLFAMPYHASAVPPEHLPFRRSRRTK